METQQRYVYVMGRGHSGSTVLDALLGNADNARGIGEVVAGIDGTHPCSCGDPVDECSHWQDIRRRLETDTQLSWQQVVRRVAGDAHILNFVRVLLATASTQFVDEERKSISILAQAIRTETGASHIVDS